MEKWDFKVDYENDGPNGTKDSKLPQVGTKDIKQIQKEIREVMRQITGTLFSFTYLFIRFTISQNVLKLEEPNEKIV